MAEVVSVVGRSDFSQVRRDLRRLDQQVDDVGANLNQSLAAEDGTAQLQSNLDQISGTLNNIANFSLGAGTTILGTLGAIGSKAVQVAGQIEEAELSFRTFFDVAEGRQRELASEVRRQVEDLAETTPATFESLLSGLQLTRGTRGRIAPNQTGIDQRLADLREEAIFSRVFGVQGGIRQLERTRLALSQGSIRTRRLTASRIVEPLIGQLQEQGFSVQNIEDIQQLRDAGEIAGTELVQAFDDAVEDGIEGFAGEVDELITTKIQNIGDELFQIGGRLGRPIVDGLSDFIDDNILGEGNLEDLTEALESPRVQAGVRDAFENIASDFGFIGEGIDSLTEFIEQNPRALGEFIEQMYELGRALLTIGSSLKVISGSLNAVGGFAGLTALFTGGSGIGSFIGGRLAAGQSLLGGVADSFTGRGGGGFASNTAALFGRGFGTTFTGSTVAGTRGLLSGATATSAGALGRLTALGLSVPAAALGPTSIIGGIAGRERAGRVADARRRFFAAQTREERTAARADIFNTFRALDDRPDGPPLGGPVGAIGGPIVRGNAIRNIEVSFNLLKQIPSRLGDFLERAGPMNAELEDAAERAGWVEEALNMMNKAARDFAREQTNILQERNRALRRPVREARSALQRGEPLTQNQFDVLSATRSPGAPARFQAVPPGFVGPLPPGEDETGRRVNLIPVPVEGVGPGELPGGDQTPGLQQIQAENRVAAARRGVDIAQASQITRIFGASRIEQNEQQLSVLDARLELQRAIAEKDGEITKAEERSLEQLRIRRDSLEEHLERQRAIAAKTQRVIEGFQLDARIAAAGATPLAGARAQVGAARRAFQIAQEGGPGISELDVRRRRADLVEARASAIDTFQQRQQGIADAQLRQRLAGPITDVAAARARLEKAREDLRRARARNAPQDVIEARKADVREAEAQLQRVQFERRRQTEGFFGFGPGAALDRREANIQQELRIARQEQDLPRIRNLQRQRALLSGEREQLNFRQSLRRQSLRNQLDPLSQAQPGNIVSPLAEDRLSTLRGRESDVLSRVRTLRGRRTELQARLQEVDDAQRRDQLKEQLEAVNDKLDQANTELETIQDEIKNLGLTDIQATIVNQLAGAGQFVEGQSFQGGEFGRSIGGAVLQQGVSNLQDSFTRSLGEQGIGGFLGSALGGVGAGIVGVLGNLALNSIFGGGGPQVPFREPTPVVVTEILDRKFDRFLLSNTRDAFADTSIRRARLT